MYGPPKGASYSIALPLDERAAHRRLLEKNIPIVVDLHNGRGTARMWTCDFTAGIRPHQRQLPNVGLSSTDFSLWGSI